MDDKDIPHAERPHHPTSPSSLSLREECPCYESRGGSSEAAERGTMQHEAVETGEDSEFLRDHEALAVASCLEFCDLLVEREYGGNPGHALIEPYLPIDGRKLGVDGVQFEGSTAGYCDRAFVSLDEKFADIIDWKFGMYAVTDAEHNIQGMSYMLGLVRKFPTLERVTVHFVAPHRDEWTFHTFRKEDFEWVYLRVVTCVRRAWEARNRRTRGDWSMATPSTSACLFCEFADGRCPKLTEKCIEIGRKVSPLSFPADLRPERCADPKNAAIGIQLSGVVKNWAEKFRKAITDRAVDELDFVPEGYILTTMQRRRVVSVAGIREIAKDKFGLTEDEVNSASDVALGKLEDIVRLKSPRGSKEAAAKEFSAALEEAKYVEKGDPFPCLRQTKGVATKTKTD